MHLATWKLKLILYNEKNTTIAFNDLFNLCPKYIDLASDLHVFNSENTPSKNKQPLSYCDTLQKSLTNRHEYEFNAFVDH